MPEDETHPTASKGGTAANDTGAAATRLDAAVLTLARLIGRQMARDAFERLNAANDNSPTDDEESR